MRKKPKHENISGICASVGGTKMHIMSLQRLFYFLDQKQKRYSSLYKSYATTRETSLNEEGKLKSPNLL